VQLGGRPLCDDVDEQIDRVGVNVRRGPGEPAHFAGRDRRRDELGGDRFVERRVAVRVVDGIHDVQLVFFEPLEPSISQLSR
jgi:hypothetical protein